MNFSLQSDSPTSDARPLRGRVVVVTRPRAQSDALTRQLIALGAAVVGVPAFSIVPVESPEFEGALRSASADSSDVLIVFTSVNSVRRFVEMCAHLSITAADFADASVATVGPTTEREAEGAGLQSDVVAAVHTAEGLVVSIASAPLPLERMTVLYPRARDAQGEIESGLAPLVSTMEAHVVYGLAVEEQSPSFHTRPDVVTFASSSAVTYFEQVVTAEDATLVKQSLPVVCIGPATADTATHLGYTNVITAQVHTAAGLIDAVVELLSMKG